MRIAGLSDKAAQIWGQIQGGGAPGPLKPMMVAEARAGAPWRGRSIIQLIELDNYVQVMIEVGEEETDAGLRRLIPLALQWRDWVVEIQGPWTAGGRGRFLLLLDSEQRAGVSYQQLAERLTRNLGGLLSEFLAWERQSRTRHRGGVKRPAGADDFWPNPFAKVHAVELLTDLGIAEEDAAQHVKEGLRRLRDGRKPFVGPGPITRQRVIDVLRAWRRHHDTPAYRERWRLRPLAAGRRRRTKMSTGR